jgi:hypothetical protein
VTSFSPDLFRLLPLAVSGFHQQFYGAARPLRSPLSVPMLFARWGCLGKFTAATHPDQQLGPQHRSVKENYCEARERKIRVS